MNQWLSSYVSTEFNNVHRPAEGVTASDCWRAPPPPPPGAEGWCWSGVFVCCCCAA
jgi:hypothetical protein